MSFSGASDSLFKTVNSIFGTLYIYTYLAGGSTSSVKGVFSNEWIEINGISTKKPILKIRVADISADPVEGDTVFINTILYTVMDSQQDGLGSAILILEKT